MHRSSTCLRHRLPMEFVPIAHVNHSRPRRSCAHSSATVSAVSGVACRRSWQPKLTKNRGRVPKRHDHENGIFLLNVFKAVLLDFSLVHDSIGAPEFVPSRGSARVGIWSRSGACRRAPLHSDSTGR